MLKYNDLIQYTQKFITTPFCNLYDRGIKIYGDGEDTFFDLSLNYSITNGDLILQFYDVRKGKFIEEFSKRFELCEGSEALFTYNHLKRLLNRRCTNEVS